MGVSCLSPNMQDIQKTSTLIYTVTASIFECIQTDNLLHQGKRLVLRSLTSKWFLPFYLLASVKHLPEGIRDSPLFLTPLQTNLNGTGLAPFMYMCQTMAKPIRPPVTSSCTWQTGIMQSDRGGVRGCLGRLLLSSGRGYPLDKVHCWLDTELF